MKQYLSKSEALKSLKITGFEQIDSKNFQGFLGLFKDLDPAIAKLALSQIPDFAKLVMSTLDSFKHNYDRTIDCIMKTHSDYNDFCSQITDILSNMSKDPNNNSEDKMLIVQALLELEARRSKKDREIIDDVKEEREKSNNLIKGIVGVALVTALSGLVIMLGTRQPKKVNADRQKKPL